MLTWDEARATIIETTELGYTLKSLDRLWVAATVEDGSTPFARDYPEFIGNVVYALTSKGGGYELMDDVAVFRSRRECEAFIDSLGEPYTQWWFPLNLGDETRWEHAFLDGELPDLTGAGYTPKFAGSRRYFRYRQEVHRLTREHMRVTGRPYCVCEDGKCFL